MIDEITPRIEIASNFAKHATSIAKSIGKSRNTATRNQ
jgi:hypothetical protein